MPAPRQAPLPAHASLALLYVGITLIFGSLGSMIALLHDPPGGWMYAVLLYLLSGFLAVGWAFMFQRRGRWFLLLLPRILLPAVGTPLLIPRIWHWSILHVGDGYSELVRRIILAPMAMASISIGFTLVIQCLTSVERPGTRARAELALAAQIHASLVTPITLSWNSLQIHGTSKPSGEMGGDLIDVVATDHRLDLFLADVSGHGVRAGVVMGTLKATVRTARREEGQVFDHLVTLNAVLADLIESSMFATAVWVRFEPAPTQTASPIAIRASIIVAGHPPVFGSRAADRQRHEIGGESMPLGILPVQPFPVKFFDLAPGDMASREWKYYLAWCAVHRNDRAAAAVPLFIAAGEQHFNTPASFYNAACCAALTHEDDQAFALLARAVEAGFSDADLVVSDPDLVTLHDDPRFEPLVARILAAPEANGGN